MRRLERGASQLAIQNLDAVFRFHHFQERLEIIGGYLVSETAAAAVEHHHDLVWNCDPEFCRQLVVAHILGSRDLHFEVMIATAKCADLVVATVNRAFADFRCISAGDTTVFLGKFEVLRPAVIVFDAPARALFDQVSKIVTRQFQKAMTAYARRYAFE